MRILTGPFSRDVGLRETEDHPDTRFFPDDGRPFHDVLADLPASWVPDVVVVWSPEYRLLPPGLADCPYPLVFVCGDWNLGLHRTVQCLAMADHIVTDRHGVETMQRLGFDNVSYWPAFSFDPQIHRLRPGEPCRFDVSFIGNLNHAIHQDRARWLARLARLSDRYRIGILSGVTGDAYGQVLSQSRLVFNHSVRGEMNMRAYEAPAAGRVLLMEAPNREVREILQNGQECALYGDEDFEAVVTALLADPEHCDRIAAAGHARIRQETFRHHWHRLKALLAGLDLPRRQPRRWAQVPLAHRLLYQARQALGTISPNGLPRSLQLIHDAYASQPHDPEVRHGVAAIASFAAERSADAHFRTRLVQAASQTFQRLLQDFPDYSLAWLNYARLMEGLQQGAEAQHAYARALASAPVANPLILDDVISPFRHGRFEVEWTRALALQNPAMARRLIAAAAATALAEALLPQQPSRALALLMQATEADPADDTAWRLQGLACRQMGDGAGALAAWERGLALQPYQFDVRLALGQLLLERGDYAKLESLLHETGCLIRASAPGYDEWLPAFTAVRERFRPRRWGLDADRLDRDWPTIVLAYCRRFTALDPVELYVQTDSIARQAGRLIHDLQAAGLAPAQAPHLVFVAPNQAAAEDVLWLEAAPPAWQPESCPASRRGPD